MKKATKFLQRAYIDGSEMILESLEEVDDLRNKKSTFIIFGDDDNGEVYYRGHKIDIRAFTISYNILKYFVQIVGSSCSYKEIYNACWPPGRLSEEDLSEKTTRIKDIFHSAMKELREKVGNRFNPYIDIDAGVFVRSTMKSCWILRRSTGCGGQTQISISLASSQ